MPNSFMLHNWPNKPKCFVPDSPILILGSKTWTYTDNLVTQSCFNKVGHLLVCKQSKRGWEAQIFYSYFVMSQLYETNTHSYGFNIWGSLKTVFIPCFEK